MNVFQGLLVAALLSGLPALALGYAYGTASPDGKSVQQNQVSGKPVIWYNPEQNFVFDFGGDYDASAISAMGDWNAVGTPLHWTLGSAAAQPCVSTDHINSAGWRATTCDNSSYGDAIAVTKRSYEKIGDTWYLADSDIVVDNTQTWDPHYDGPLRSNHTQDFRRVILHELGHALGLDHPDDAGQTVSAIMNSKISDIHSLQQDDKDGITALYTGIIGTTSNSAGQSGSSSGGAGSTVWLLPLLACAVLRRRASRVAGRELPV
jgi:hypothetical protein